MTLIATGNASYAGTDFLETLRTVLGELGSPHIPHFPELPDRGVGADRIGRASGFLTDLALEVTSFGWRITDHPGRDAERAHRVLRRDLDMLEEAIEGISLPRFKTQILGPWTLAASIYLKNGERALSDLGAVRDIAESYRAGVVEHVNTLQRIFGGSVELSVQIDETAASKVLDGAIPTVSGYRRLAAVPRDDFDAALQTVVRALHNVKAFVGVNLGQLPVNHLALERIEADAVMAVPPWHDHSTDEEIARLFEEGKQLWAPFTPAAPSSLTVPAPKRTGVFTARNNPAESADTNQRQGANETDVPLNAVADRQARRFRSWWQSVGVEQKYLSNVQVMPTGAITTGDSRQIARLLSVATDIADKIAD